MWSLETVCVKAGVHGFLMWEAQLSPLGLLRFKMSSVCFPIDGRATRGVFAKTHSVFI